MKLFQKFLILPIFFICLIFLFLTLNFNNVLAAIVCDESGNCVDSESGVITGVSDDSQSDLSEKTSNFNFTCDNYVYPWCDNTSEMGGSSGLVARFYNIALALVGATAFGAFVFGAIKYTLSEGNPGKMQDALAWIWGAVWGVVLLFGGYLLLNTINPEIVSLESPNIEGVTITTTESTDTVSTGSYYYDKNPEYLDKASDESNWTDIEKSTLYSHNEAVSLLNSAGISVTGTNGLCADQSESSCTSLNGIPQSTIDALVEISKAMKSAGYSDVSITVTGGTESGHQSQGFNKNSIDLKYSEDVYNYLQSNGYNAVHECGSSSYCPTHATGDHISVYNL